MLNSTLNRPKCKYCGNYLRLREHIICGNIHKPRRENGILKTNERLEQGSEKTSEHILMSQGKNTHRKQVFNCLSLCSIYLYNKLFPRFDKYRR